MKIFFILLFTVGAFFTSDIEAQKAQTLKATFTGAEQVTYYFSQGHKTIAFQKLTRRYCKLITSMMTL
ncbi:MAG: YHS domain-containing protein [Flavobacteriales bacterium]|jgi:YHS domain-containing protein